MLKSCGELDLATEPVRIDPCCELGRKDFDDDLAIEVGLGCNEDARHSRAAELAVNAIGVAEYLLKLALKVGSHRTNIEPNPASETLEATRSTVPAP